MSRCLTIALTFVSLVRAAGLAASDASEFGVCEHPTFTTDHARSAAQYAIMHRAGIGITRTDFHWTALSGSDAQAPLDFTNFDAVVRTARSSHMALLPIVTHAPAFALPLPQHLDLWRAYVHALVARFATEMRSWEIWNEHNFPNDGFWGAEDHHTANYTQTLRAAYEEIKAIDPTLQVVYGGTAHIPLDYIEQTLRAGAGNSYDVMNVHPYGTATIPEAYLFEQLRGLHALLAKYGQDGKPLWATEVGWPTVVAHRPWLYKALLPKAFATLGIVPEQTTLAVISDLGNGFLEQAPNYDIAGNLPAFKAVRRCLLTDIATLDVATCPVLVPCRMETFPQAFFGDLVAYVRRGGTIVLPEGLPFSNDKVVTGAGTTPSAPFLADKQKALHIDAQGIWSLGIAETTQIEVPGFTPPDTAMSNARFLGERNLAEGDRFIPLAYGVDGAKRYPFAGIYQLRSSLRGNVIAVLARDQGVQEETSRELQARILPRAFLIMLAEGVSKVFWYKLTSSGTDAGGERERNFGLLDNADGEKPAFRSYAALIAQRPEGSTRPLITNESGVYHATWKKPDGARVHAVWTAEDDAHVTIPGAVTGAVGYLGEPFTVQQVAGGVAFTASPRIVYLASN